MLRFLYKNKRTSKSTTYMTDFPTLFLGAERKKFCFERSRSIFSALSGGLTFQEFMANRHTRTSASTLSRVHPLRVLHLGGLMKGKGNDQLPQICFLVSGSGVRMSSVFAGTQGKQSARPLY